MSQKKSNATNESKGPIEEVNQLLSMEEVGEDGESEEEEEQQVPGRGSLKDDTKEPEEVDYPMIKVVGDVTEGTGVELPSQIQQIIAKELDNPRKLRRVDVQSLPTRQYLEMTVLPIVMQSMNALCKERPADPIEYLAAYLLCHRGKFQPS